MGLVEVGVGLIPAGGGCKEMAVRVAQLLPPGASQLPNKPELISFLTRPFESIATARVTGSGFEGRDLNYLRPRARPSRPSSRWTVRVIGRRSRRWCRWPARTDGPCWSWWPTI